MEWYSSDVGQPERDLVDGKKALDHRSYQCMLSRGVHAYGNVEIYFFINDWNVRGDCCDRTASTEKDIE